MRFLHTADWQIGMKAAVLGDAGARVREERLAAGRRVVETAKSHDVDFLLVAGDLFEDNAVDRVLVQKVADILNSFGGPVFVIPGNHDPLVPGSVCRKSSGSGLGYCDLVSSIKKLAMIFLAKPSTSSKKKRRSS
jgi:DNA repair exonuclease SbcCD nuclease subunit